MEGENPAPGPAEKPSKGSTFNNSVTALNGAVNPETKLPAGESDVEVHSEAVTQTKTSSKKKKKRVVAPKIELPPIPGESDEERVYWTKELRPNRPTVPISTYGILNASFRSHLSTFLTPSCSSLTLTTSRLILRQVQIEDLGAIKRIKCEPIVQRTQLYGSPHESFIKDGFLQNYVRASMPRVPSGEGSSGCRAQYFFAITLKKPEEVEVGDGSKLKLGNRIKNAEGYIGNIAIDLSCSKTSNLFPKPRKIYTQPTFDQTASAELNGDMFYEIHPQLWGKGIMSEAFAEMVRFAMEDVGCLTLTCDPLKGNEASIKLCAKHGFKYTHISTDNPYKKPQVWHKLTRRDWWEKHKAGEVMKGTYDGIMLCRWCMNPQAQGPAYRCSGCEWAVYCSRECQRADWVFEGGHQSECDKKVIEP